MKKYGILAYPTGHSLSPLIHEAAFKVAEIDAEYQLYNLPPSQIPALVKMLKAGKIDGLSVSLPYKQTMMAYMDEISPAAREIGAINTIIQKEGKLSGDNTDYLGFEDALSEAFSEASSDGRNQDSGAGRAKRGGTGSSPVSPKMTQTKDMLQDGELRHRDFQQILNGKAAFILGAGGSARALIYSLLRAGAPVFIQNRTRAKANDLAAEFDQKFLAPEIHSLDWGQFPPGTGTAKILIHTTSYWLENRNITASELPWFCRPNFFKQFKLVIDIAYNCGLKNFPNPLITPLLSGAREQDIAIVSGEKMLTHQAAHQFQIWTGRTPPLAAMSQALGAFFS